MIQIPRNSSLARFNAIEFIEGGSIASIAADVIPSCADLQRVERYLAEFETAHPGLLTQSTGVDAIKAFLAIAAYSRFLAEELLRHPDWLFEMPDVHRKISSEEYRARLKDFFPGRPQPAMPEALDLATFRRRELLRIVVRDALNIGTLDEITEEISNLADATLQETLERVFGAVAQRYGYPSDSLNGSNPFCVLALGKLGGRELNYSSDIDLMFLYVENGETSGPEVITNREFYKKVANRFTDLLSTYTREGLCYRVDLRLRPEGALGEVCISLEGARRYYDRRARDWELQMLIKARPVAGNLAVGFDLIRHVEPAIYASSTDFSAIETMAASRGKLAQKFSEKYCANGDTDVKFSRGGIRDIEFLAQCLQRLHGGRDVTLRRGGTLAALERLLELDLISTTEHAKLSDAYAFLRHLEHRLQFENDQQTHLLPARAAELDGIAARMPAAYELCRQRHPGRELLQQVKQHFENVQIIYARIVHAQRPLSYSPVDLISAVEPRDERLPEVRPAQMAGAILWADLAAEVEKHSPIWAHYFRYHAVDSAAERLQALWSVVRDDDQARSLIERSSTVADYVLQLVVASPFLSGQLIADVSLLAEVADVAERPARRAAFESLASPLNDLAALRQFYRREMLRIQTASICLAEPVFQTLDRTSALAEFMIARVYRVALERAIAAARRAKSSDHPIAEPQNEMMVVALGRLGMREFDLGSDADLLFIIPDAERERHEFWTHVAEHVIEILTAYSPEGRVLSIDTRLRPNGREGPLVQAESTYTDYFAHHAEAWEGIAYMKARAVGGDTERATRFLTALQEADWRRWGQSGRSKHDLKQMRLRLEREQGSKNPLKAGHGGYYDADFALMYLRLKGAGLFFKSLNTPERIDIVEKMGHLEREDAEFLLRATTFYRAIDHGLRLTSGHAEGTLPKSAAEQDALTALVARWSDQCASGERIEDEMLIVREDMRQLFNRLFA